MIDFKNPVTRLCKAVLDCNLVAAREALDDGADPNAVDWDHPGAWKLIRQKPRGFTILHEAVSLSSDFVNNGNNSSVMGLLIRRGADLHAVDESGNTPLHAAAYAGQWHACGVLIRLGAEVNCANNKQVTPLHAAAAHGCTEVCRLLVTHGIDIEALDHEGHTALEVAKAKGRTETASYLFAVAAKKRLLNPAPVSLTD